jgi:hypothetical protein
MGEKTRESKLLVEFLIAYARIGLMGTMGAVGAFDSMILLKAKSFCCPHRISI